MSRKTEVASGPDASSSYGGEIEGVKVCEEHEPCVEGMVMIKMHFGPV